MASLQAQLTSKLPFSDLKGKRGHYLHVFMFWLLIYVTVTSIVLLAMVVSVTAFCSA